MFSSLSLGFWCALRLRSYSYYAEPTHSSFAWGFWWLNVVICAYCILYWALKRFPDGTPALLTTTGQIWVWQLVAAFVLLVMDASPWHLLWLAPVSVAMSIIVHRIVYNVRLNQRIKMLEVQNPDYFKVAAPASVSSSTQTPLRWWPRLMMWFFKFYKRRKNPWVGFILVLLFGPFGFLYHSWKTALVVFFIAGPLWIAYLRHTRFDLIENPWAHYTALAVLAAFASLQIKALRSQMDQEAPERANGKEAVANKPVPAGQSSELEALRQESRKRGKSEVACKAGALLDSDAKRDVLYDSLGEHPALAEKLRHYWPYLIRSHVTPTPLEVSLMFNNMAVKLVEEGEPFIALKSIESALLFDEGGPDHWVAQAEVLCALKDRSAARYASDVIEYQDAHDAATKAGLQFPYYAGHKVLRGEYRRMLEIIQICYDHKEWVDSHTFMEQAGIFNS